MDYARPKPRTSPTQVALRVTREHWIAESWGGRYYRKGAVLYVSRAQADSLLGDTGPGGVVEAPPRKRKGTHGTASAVDPVGHTPPTGTVYGPPVAPWWHASRWVAKPEKVIVRLRERVQFGTPARSYAAGSLLHVPARRAAELVSASYATAIEPRDIVPSSCRPDVLLENSSGVLRWAMADEPAHAIEDVTPRIEPPPPLPPPLPDGMRRVFFTEMVHFGGKWFGIGPATISEARAEASIAAGVAKPLVTPAVAA
jgi:hypothetical protein